MADERKGSLTLILVILSLVRTAAVLYQLILALIRKRESLTIREQRALNHYFWQNAQIEGEATRYLGCVKGGVADPETEDEAEKQPTGLLTGTTYEEARVMDHNCYPYPQNFNPNATSVIMDAILGKPVDVKFAVHCGWDVGGWALGKFYDPHPVIALKAQGAPYTNEEAADILGQLKATNGTALKTGDGIDWKALADVIFAWISKNK